MSTYNTDLQTNNTSLEEILTTINNLPEAGGSGGFITNKLNGTIFDCTSQTSDIVLYTYTSKDILNDEFCRFTFYQPGGTITFSSSDYIYTGSAGKLKMSKINDYTINIIKTTPTPISNYTPIETTADFCILFANANGEPDMDFFSTKVISYVNMD